MDERDISSEADAAPIGVNFGYAAFQIAKALRTADEHDDAATRDRALEKVARWESVLNSILSGEVEYGTRTPVRDVPAWATLEVLTGGFATGALLAGGPLLPHETEQLPTRQPIAADEARRALNSHFLTDSGLAELNERLHTGCYDIAVPEEGALLVVAWLLKIGHAERARALIEELAPYFSRIRFYPIPLERPRRFGASVHIQTVAQTLSSLREIKPNLRIVAQKETVEIWLPFYDRIVAIFLETVVDGWPCRLYPQNWADRARELLTEYAECRRTHGQSRKLERPNEHATQLRDYLQKCARDPAALIGRDIGRIRLILNRYVAKRGAPGSPQCAESRRRQTADVGSPPFHALAGIVAARLQHLPQDEPVDDVRFLQSPVTEPESASNGIAVHTPIPDTIRRKVERCLNDTVAALVERGLITSGEALARVLPQMTAGVRALGIQDAALRHLYSAIYRAFRRRRSLLLLNLEKQVQLEELPWIAAIEEFRTDSLSTCEVARQTLEELAVLTLGSFPHAIIPNKLVQELRALVEVAELHIPLVDELAADIFMGQFSGKFVDSARMAARLLDGGLYSRYYGIDYSQIRDIQDSEKPAVIGWFRRRTPSKSGGFAELCARRAGVEPGTWSPATNGMIIEQQQIITTQNLAALFVGLDLARSMNSQLDSMARSCFAWICKRLQMKIDNWHARLTSVKNAAYAWRQMIFYLSLLPEREIAGFLDWAGEHYGKQSPDFQDHFRPALDGLRIVVGGGDLHGNNSDDSSPRRFLGWSDSRHWLLTDRRYSK